MSRDVTCPKCQSELRIRAVPQSGLVRCPSCQVQIRLAPDVDEEDDDFDTEVVTRPVKRSRSKRSKSSDTAVMIFAIRAVLACVSVVALILAGQVIWQKIKMREGPEDNAAVVTDGVKDPQTLEQIKRDREALKSKR